MEIIDLKITSYFRFANEFNKNFTVLLFTLLLCQ